MNLWQHVVEEEDTIVAPHDYPGRCENDPVVWYTNTPPKIHVTWDGPAWLPCDNPNGSNVRLRSNPNLSTITEEKP